jgi:DNA-binding MurR/RpiR family transcriptional regulator
MNALDQRTSSPHGDSTPETSDFAEDFLLRVAGARGSLTANDERVIAELRENPEALAFHTSESLAQSADVSRAAVVRFARKLGFAGFTELRDAARGAVKQQRESPLGRFAGDPSDSLPGRKLEQDVQNLRATLALSEDAIVSAAKALGAARRIYVVGNRKTYGLALYAQRMLRGIRSAVHLVDPGYPDDLAGIGPEDVVLAFVFRRYSPNTIALLEAAQQCGACTVVVTDGGGHGFTAGANHALVALADSPSLYDSMVAPMWLLEVLVAETAAVDRSRSRATLEAVEQFTEDHKLLLD